MKRLSWLRVPYFLMVICFHMSAYATDCMICGDPVESNQPGLTCPDGHALDSECLYELLNQNPLISPFFKSGLTCLYRNENGQPTCKHRHTPSSLLSGLNEENRQSITSRYEKEISPGDESEIQKEALKLMERIQEAFTLFCSWSSCRGTVDEVENLSQECSAAIHPQCGKYLCYLCFIPLHDQPSAHYHAATHSDKAHEDRGEAIVKRYHWIIHRKQLDHLAFRGRVHPVIRERALQELSQAYLESSQTLLDPNDLAGPKTPPIENFYLKEKHMWPLPAGIHTSAWIQEVQESGLSDSEKIELLQNELIFRFQKHELSECKTLGEEILKLDPHAKLLVSLDKKFQNGVELDYFDRYAKDEAWKMASSVSVRRNVINFNEKFKPLLQQSLIPFMHLNRIFDLKEISESASNFYQDPTRLTHTETLALVQKLILKEIEIQAQLLDLNSGEAQELNRRLSSAYHRLINDPTFAFNEASFRKDLGEAQVNVSAAHKLRQNNLALEKFSWLQSEFKSVYEIPIDQQEITPTPFVDLVQSRLASSPIPQEYQEALQLDASKIPSRILKLAKTHAKIDTLTLEAWLAPTRVDSPFSSELERAYLSLFLRGTPDQIKQAKQEIQELRVKPLVQILSQEKDLTKLMGYFPQWKLSQELVLLNVFQALQLDPNNPFMSQIKAHLNVRLYWHIADSVIQHIAGITGFQAKTITQSLKSHLEEKIGIPTWVTWNKHKKYLIQNLMEHEIKQKSNHWSLNESEIEQFKEDLKAAYAHLPQIEEYRKASTSAYVKVSTLAILRQNELSNDLQSELEQELQAIFAISPDQMEPHPFPRSEGDSLVSSRQLALAQFRAKYDLNKLLTQWPLSGRIQADLHQGLIHSYLQLEGHFSHSSLSGILYAQMRALVEGMGHPLDGETYYRALFQLGSPTTYLDRPFIEKSLEKLRLQSKSDRDLFLAQELVKREYFLVRNSFQGSVADHKASLEGLDLKACASAYLDPSKNTSELRLQNLLFSHLVEKASYSSPSNSLEKSWSTQALLNGYRQAGYQGLDQLYTEQQAQWLATHGQLSPTQKDQLVHELSEMRPLLRIFDPTQWDNFLTYIYSDKATQLSTWPWSHPDLFSHPFAPSFTPPLSMRGILIHTARSLWEEGKLNGHDFNSSKHLSEEYTHFQDVARQYLREHSSEFSDLDQKILVRLAAREYQLSESETHTLNEEVQQDSSWEKQRLALKRAWANACVRRLQLNSEDPNQIREFRDRLVQTLNYNELHLNPVTYETSEILPREFALRDGKKHSLTPDQVDELTHLFNELYQKNRNQVELSELSMIGAKTQTHRISNPLHLNKAEQDRLFERTLEAWNQEPLNTAKEPEKRQAKMDKILLELRPDYQPKAAPKRRLSQSEGSSSKTKKQPKRRPSESEGSKPRKRMKSQL